MRQPLQHRSVPTPFPDFVTFDCLTDRGLIRQEYERYLPLPRLGEGRGEALAVGSWIRPPPVRPLARPTSRTADFVTFDCLTDRGLIRQETTNDICLSPDSERVGERPWRSGRGSDHAQCGRYRVRAPQGHWSLHISRRWESLSFHPPSGRVARNERGG